MKKLTLKEARAKGRLKEFAEQHNKERGDESRFKRALKSMERVKK